MHGGKSWLIAHLAAQAKIGSHVVGVHPNVHKGVGDRADPVGSAGVNPSSPDNGRGDKVVVAVQEDDLRGGGWRKGKNKHSVSAGTNNAKDH